MASSKAKSRVPAPKRAPPPMSLSERLRPWLLGAVTTLLVARPLVPSEASTVRGYGLPFVMCWLIVLALWALGAVRDRRLAARCGWGDAAVAALLAWHSIGAIVGVWTGAPRPAINVMWEWLALGAAFWLVRQLVRPGVEMRALAGVMIALAVSLSAYGYYQYFVTMPETRRAFELDEDAALRAAGIATDDPRTRHLFRERLFSTEPLATFELTNSLAGLLAPWLIFAVGIAVGGNHAGRSRRTLAALVAFSLLIGGCLLLTKSRSAYLAAGLGLPLAWLACRPAGLRAHWKLPAGLMVVVAVLTAAAILVGGLDLKVATEAAKSLVYRMQYWQATWQIIRDHPWLGTSPGNFGDYYPQYKLPQASEEIQDPHNLLMEVWSTAGTPALVALVAVLALALWRQVRPIRRERPQAESVATARPVLLGAIGGLPLAYFAGLAVGLAPPLTVLLIAVAVGSAAVRVLHQWISHGTLPVMLPGVALMVLLINLLAAGGIGFPGVAGTFWLLLALLFNITGPQETNYAAGRTAAILSLLIAALLLAACGVTAYLPVMKRLQLMSQAEYEPARLQQHLDSAAAADPWSADPWVELAQLHLVRWRETRSARDFEQFQTAIREMLARRPRASELWMKSGDWHQQAWRLSADPAHLKAAIEHYHRSVELYPNSPQRRAKLAIALHDSGRESQADSQRTEALRLDALTPHADQKLPPELRAELLRNSDK